MDHSVKATVRRMLIQYPSLYESKSDCFSHLFLTLGGGYDWIGGCLVDPVQDRQGNDEPRWADESGDPGRHDLDIKSHELIEVYMRQSRILHAKRENMLVRFALENFDAMFEQSVTLTSPYLWAGEYTPLFNMPDDVQEDWREACQQTSQALGVWLYHQRNHDMPAKVEETFTRNVAFRQKHFAESDQRMRDIFKEVLKDKE